MTAPRPAALRLWTRNSGARSPKPPFGLAAWSATAEAIAVLVDGSEIDPADAGALAAQIPHATELPSATPVFVLEHAARRGGVLGMLGAGRVSLTRAARCTALVARGYVAVGAGVDDASGRDLVWGLSSPC